jgi:hypothetical protein
MRPVATPRIPCTLERTPAGNHVRVNRLSEANTADCPTPSIPRAAYSAGNCGAQACMPKPSDHNRIMPVSMMCTPSRSLSAPSGI